MNIIIDKKKGRSIELIHNHVSKTEATNIVADIAENIVKNCRRHYSRTS